MSAGELSALEGWLGRTVGDALSAALSVAEPAGSSPAWDALREKFQVAAVGQEERLRGAKVTGMLFGVPPDELYKVLGNTAKEAEERLKAIPFPDDGPQQRRWERLRSLIGRLRDDTMKEYRKRVMPKRSMFSQALASAQAKQPAFKQTTEAFVMRCEGCGAPRLKLDLFTCEYCDSPYAKPEG